MHLTYVEVDVHYERNRVHCSVDSEDPVLNCNKIKLNNLVQLNIFWGKRYVNNFHDNAFPTR